MSAPFRKFEPLIEIQPVPVKPKEFDVIDAGIPIVQNRKAVLYIEDAFTYDIKWQDYPKYHILHCSTLQDMERCGQYSEYHASVRTDGLFLVRLSETDERSLFKLRICKNCLKKLNEQYGYGVFPTDPKEFPLADWFENTDDFNQINPTDGPFDYLSDDWKKRSHACRNKASWICQECNINLENDRHLLHAHHKWGTKYNDPDDLIALCIRCHSEQEGEGHSTIKFYSAYKEFMKKYGDLPQNRYQTNLPNRQSTVVNEKYINPSSQTTELEDDIPF